MLGGWSVFRHMSCFGWAWPPAHPVPSLRPYFQAWHVRKPRRCRLTEGWASSLRRQQGRPGLQVVLSVAVPWEAPCACRPVRSYVHKAVFGCFVSRVSCVCLVLCFLGNFEVNSCSVSRVALTSLSDCILSPFASIRWCPGPLSPPPPHHRPFSFGALDCWDRGTQLLSEQGPFVGCCLTFPSCLSPPPPPHPGPLPAPLRCVSCALSQPPAGCYFVYMWWWLCWSPFFFVYLILCIWEIPMCLNELCFIYSDCCTVHCHFIDHLLIDCS